MARHVNLSGHKFNKLNLISINKKDKGIIYYNCVCDCGNVFIGRGTAIKAGQIKSCGCFRKQRSNTIILKNGVRAKSMKEYSIWVAMKQRCYNPKYKQFLDYGGRGIKVSDKWRVSFEAFFDDMGERPHNHSIDRIDINGDYTAENCRWATCKVQNNNKRNNVPLTAFGITHNITEWSKLIGLSQASLSVRIIKGELIEDVINELNSDNYRYNKGRKVLIKIENGNVILINKIRKFQ